MSCLFHQYTFSLKVLFHIICIVWQHFLDSHLRAKVLSLNQIMKHCQHAMQIESQCLSPTRKTTPKLPPPILTHSPPRGPVRSSNLMTSNRSIVVCFERAVATVEGWYLLTIVKASQPLYQTNRKHCGRAGAVIDRRRASFAPFKLLIPHQLSRRSLRFTHMRNAYCCRRQGAAS